MMKYPKIYFIILILIGIILSVAMYGVKTPYESSLAPFYALLGNPGKSFDSIVSKVLSVDDMDEKQYGDIIASWYFYNNDSENRDVLYLKSIADNLSEFTKKDFEYRIFIDDSYIPNACAYPGGVIVINRGLLDILDNEAQLVSIIAHEIGHVESSHCLNAVKYELALKKITDTDIGELFDIMNYYFINNSFSKTQEDEADDYAYKMLHLTDYDPSALGESFTALHNYIEEEGEQVSSEADLIRDYEASHLPLLIRAEKYSSMAEVWWKKNSRSIKYLGRKNLEKRLSYYQKKFFGEEKRYINYQD